MYILQQETYAELTNPKAGVSGMEYNEVQLDFKYTGIAQGVLFFTENTGNEAECL